MDDITDIIRQRRSVRSFDGTSLSDNARRSLLQAIDEFRDPFGGRVTIRLRQFDLRGGYRPGTYGMIRGASDFFLVGMADDEASALSAGFRFEEVVLRTWQLGLGTCWIAATFRGSDFERGETWPDGERLKIVSPVGIAARPGITEKIARFAVSSDKRKPIGELFFSGSFDRPLLAGDPFAEPLAMMRLAPSSTNSQPWRALTRDDEVHFYYRPKSSLSVLDCGIGLCHFTLIERHNGFHGTFRKAADVPAPPRDWRYLLTYTR